MTIDYALALLNQLQREVHRLVSKRGPIDNNRFSHSYGMCDLMTRLALDRLPSQPFEKIIFVGVQIPQRAIQTRQTYPSHTVGILHRFPLPGESDKAVLFDYACAQYGIESDLLLEVIEKELLYHQLRTLYGGGIWQPGGNWLNHLDPEHFLQSRALQDLVPQHR